MVRLRFVAWVLFLAWPVSAMGQCPIAEVFTSDGRSVGDPLSMSEGRLLAGSQTDNENGPISGSAYLFQWNGAEWVEETKLFASDGQAGARFGKSVAIDGDVLAIGAYEDPTLGNDVGAVYV